MGAIDGVQCAVITTFNEENRIVSLQVFGDIPVGSYLSDIFGFYGIQKFFDFGMSRVMDWLRGPALEQRAMNALNEEAVFDVEVVVNSFHER